MKILANDGLPNEVKVDLEALGHEVIEVRVAHEQLVNYINKNKIDTLLLQRGTLLDKEMIDDLKTLKIIIYGGTIVEIELIDYARSRGIQVIWGEESLANATAEMVFAHLFTGCRLLQEANRNMPLEGDTSFKFLQESYSTGLELAGKTMGILGMNKAGTLVAQKALALGMFVLYHDVDTPLLQADFQLPNGLNFRVDLQSSALEDFIPKVDFLTIHTAHFKQYVVDKRMLDTAVHLKGIINCAYPEAVNEVDLIEHLSEDKLLFAGIDRFEEEPNPAIQVLMNPAISLSPNIGSTTDISRMLIWDEIMSKIQELQN